MRSFSWLAFIPVLMDPGLPASAATAPLRINVKIVGSAPIIVEGLRTCLGNKIIEHGGYTLVDKLPIAEVLVFANTDVEDDVNKEGVSLAMAYVDHVDAVRLAKSLVIGQHPTTDADVRAAMRDLLASGGSVDRLNVAHVGRPSESAIQDLCVSIAKEFATVFPSSTKE